MGWLWSPVPEDADKFALAVDMLRLTFPYLFFVSMTAMAGGILNTYQRFAVPAFAPVLLNVVLILFATLVAPYYSRPGLGRSLLFAPRSGIGRRRLCRRSGAAGFHVAVSAAAQGSAGAALGHRPPRGSQNNAPDGASDLWFFGRTD
jgi:Na+-driven multidrug efflux pump